MRSILAGIAALIFTACSAPQGFEAAQPLVDAAWLNDNLDAVVVLDIRYDAGGVSGEQIFASGHIPGAVYSNYGRDQWRVTREGVPGMLPPLELSEQLIGGLGISNDDHVVIVPAGTSAVEFGAATRVYWHFKVLGHEQVSILNGGYESWRSAGYSSEMVASEPEPTIYTADYQAHLVAGVEDVIAAIESGTPLIDARSGAQYHGERKAGFAARYGTIESARNVKGSKLTVDGSGWFVDAETAASLWNAAGVPTEGEQIAFCNIGLLASLTWFAAYEVLGNKEARLYDGSVAEWSADPELPMETPEAVISVQVQ